MPSAIHVMLSTDTKGIQRGNITRAYGRMDLVRFTVAAFAGFSSRQLPRTRHARTASTTRTTRRTDRSHVSAKAGLPYTTAKLPQSLRRDRYYCLGWLDAGFCRGQDQNDNDFWSAARDGRPPQATNVGACGGGLCTAAAATADGAAAAAGLGDYTDLEK